jgi:hypothetical protein
MVMDFIEKNFDDYNRKARLTPALLVGLPIVLIATALFPDQFWSWGGVVSLLAWFGVLKLLAQLARHTGKKIEDDLYKSWGGKPTTCLLQHRTAKNKVELARQHSKLSELTGQAIPNYEEELANPDLADQIYETCVKFLISKTRDHSKFFLVYEENCNYGFRRNLLGLKPFGIIASSIGILSLGAQYAFAVGLPDKLTSFQLSNSAQIIMSLKFANYPPLAIVCLLMNTFLLIAWLFWINPDWVKDAADSYAIRLLESCENLP